MGLMKPRFGIRLAGRFRRLELPVSHSIARNGVQKRTSLGRLALQELLNVEEHGDAVGIIEVAEQTAVAGGSVDRIDSRHEHELIAGVTRSRVAAIEMPRSEQREILGGG